MTTEQWIKDHEVSLGTETPEAALMRMSDEELLGRVIAGQRGTAYARKEIHRRQSTRLHTALKRAAKAYRDAVAAYDNTCINPLYDASAEDRTMGMA